MKVIYIDYCIEYDAKGQLDNVFMGTLKFTKVKH